MRTNLFEMQKIEGLIRRSALPTFDTRLQRAYPIDYVSPSERRPDVLLSSDAGSWVGTQRNSSPPTRHSGWVSFSPAFCQQGAGRAIFGIL